MFAGIGVRVWFFVIVTLSTFLVPDMADAQTPAAGVAPPRERSTLDVPRPAVKSSVVVPDVFKKKIPNSVDDLKAIESHVQKIIPKVSSAVVGLQIGPTQGSGVVINDEGIVLTAGHVSAKPGRKVKLLFPKSKFFPNGKVLNGETLGANYGIDSGMVRITDKVPFPHVGIANVAEVSKADWCLAIGHPNGFSSDRAPVVRLGRVLDVNKSVIRSDCTLVGGDSGGPLFDMTGRVIGIHSRIGGAISFNIHVPIDTYHESWDRLASAEEWGQNPFAAFARKGEAWLGVRPGPDDDGKVIRVLSVSEKSPAEKAGVKENDIILKIDNKEISSFKDFSSALSSRRPGNRISLEIRRGEETITLYATLASRPN